MQEKKQIITINEAAEYTRISKPTLYRLTSRKMIPFHKVGGKILFDLKTLNSWLDSQRVEPEVNHV